MAQRLQDAAAAIDDAIAVRDDLVIEAWKKGASLNQIGIALGMSHKGVSKLLARHGVRQPYATVEDVEAEVQRQAERREQNPDDFGPTGSGSY